jgi:hypothetical protein
MDSISRRNEDLPVSADLHGWQYFNRGYFSAYINSDSISIVALGKCTWEDDETGGMIFKELKGDFSVEARLFPWVPEDNLKKPDCKCYIWKKILAECSTVEQAIASGGFDGLFKYLRPESR